MDLNYFDELIAGIESYFEKDAPKVYEYDKFNAWVDNGSNQLVMMKDAAFELGGSSQPTVNCTCVTTTKGIVDKDEIFVYGKDLNELTADAPFMRIAILEIDDPGDEDEEAYNAIKKLEFVRYNVHPEGYMVRVSSESNQEQVRVSNAAKTAGITFEKVGNDYISKYKEVPGVKNVKLIFATGYTDIAMLVESAKKVDDITKTLTHILDGINFDCGHCDFQEVCDDTPGLKEQHMKQREDLKRRLGGA